MLNRLRLFSIIPLCSGFQVNSEGYKLIFSNIALILKLSAETRKKKSKTTIGICQKNYLVIYPFFVSITAKFFK